MVAPTRALVVKGSTRAVSQWGSTMASSSVKATTSPVAARTPRLRARESPGREALTMVRRSSSMPFRAVRANPVVGALSTTTTR